MSDMKTVPGPGKPYTHGEDEFGEYGSIFRPEEDGEIPPPLDFAGSRELERSVREAEAAVGDERREGRR